MYASVCEHFVRSVNSNEVLIFLSHPDFSKHVLALVEKKKKRC